MLSESGLLLPVKARFLEGLNQDVIELIVAAAEPLQIPGKQTVLMEGRPANHLFMLKEGRVRYYRITSTGEEIVLHMLAAGDVFGLGSLLKHPIKYMGSAETVSNCNLLVWDHARIRSLAGTHPKLAENALSIVLDYLRRQVDRHAALVSKTAEQRLARTLLDLGHRTGTIHPHGVEIDATNQQLSSLGRHQPIHHKPPVNELGPRRNSLQETRAIGDSRA